jgi:hypothetical protein
VERTVDNLPEWYVVAWWRSGRLISVDVFETPWPDTPRALEGTTRVRIAGPLSSREAAEKRRARTVRQHVEKQGLVGGAP